MGGDPRTRYFRRLRRLRGSARRWSVLGMTLAGATAVLLPYGGVGLPDVLWAAGAGGAIALAGWRWVDLRALTAQGPPPQAVPIDPVTKVVGILSRHPTGKAAVDHLRRQRAKAQLRGTESAIVAGRLDQASAAMGGMVTRLRGPVESVAWEATQAETVLWDVAQRASGVEKARRFAPADTHHSLDTALHKLLSQLEDGVGAYERLVAAAATYLAEEDGSGGYAGSSSSRLNEAVDLLRAHAQGLTEAHHLGRVG